MALTDPARELATTLERLAAEPNEAIDARLARELGHATWSPEVFKVLFEIDQRCAFVSDLISELPLDEDVAEEAQTSIAKMRGVIGSKSVLGTNTNGIRATLSGSNITILKMLSAQIREKVSYELLSNEEREEVIASVEEFIGWLEKLQTEEADFVRQALIEGLRNFVFRAKNLHWFGTGYTLASLKDVLAAYLALEGVICTQPDNQEVSKAVLMKAQACIKGVLEKFQIAKDVTDTADWALRAYGAVAAIADGSQKISGLIGT